MEDRMREEIAKVAYELYEKSGRVPGRDTLNWLEAERIVLAREGTGADKTLPAKQQKAPAKRKK
jgi:hypothetical protein